MGKDYQAIDGWLLPAEGNFLYETSKKCSGRGVVVEIGSWKGKSTIRLASGLRDGKGGLVYAIDPHTGAPEHHDMFQTKDIWTFDEFKKNIKAAGVEKFVSPIVDRSENVAEKWDKPVEFLWIDGAHDYQWAKLDFDSWFPHLVKGGTIAYHDATFGDVKKVIVQDILFSKCFKKAGVVDSIVFATKIDPEEQSFLDRLGNFYAYLLVQLYGLRDIPLPEFLRRPAKALFKKFLRVVQ